MKRPGFDAMFHARDESDAADELDFYMQTRGESIPIQRGSRVFFLTIDGEFTGTVRRDWEWESWPARKLYVTLDCKPETPVEFHRSLFRAFTVLDHMAGV